MGKAQAGKKPGPAGASGGVAILAVPWLKLKLADTNSFIPMAWRHRLLLGTIAMGRLGNVTVGSVYLTSGKGTGPENKQTLAKLGEALAAERRPCWLGGDWQMTPGQLNRTGWLARMNYISISPDGDTCISHLSSRKIDFWVTNEA